MKLIYRLGYFGIGLFFGIIILLFFLSGKKTSCDYSPTARVLKNIRIKERSFSEEAMQFFASSNIDTSSVSTLLNDGNVDFGKSNTDREPCGLYLIYGEVNSKNLELQIENCDSTAIIQQAALAK